MRYLAFAEIAARSENFTLAIGHIRQERDNIEHRTVIPTAPAFVRSWSNSGQVRASTLNSQVANDPERTLCS
jgi:hypothetical protein